MGFWIEGSFANGGQDGARDLFVMDVWEEFSGGRGVFWEFCVGWMRRTLCRTWKSTMVMLRSIILVCVPSVPGRHVR